VEIEIQFEGLKSNAENSVKSGRHETPLWDGGESTIRHWVGDRFRVYAQTGGDLGQRMSNAFEKSFQEGSTATVLIGADCPELTAALLADAFDRLRNCPAVLGPAHDGGYYLIGLRHPIPDLFQGIAWGSNTVLADSLRVLDRAGLKPDLLPHLHDIDRPEDLPVWQQLAEAEEADLKKISVIIPTWNEERRIAASVASAAQGNPREILVVDGGSSDDTVQQARKAGAVVLSSRLGRSRQMNAGASRASGNVLLFVHADTQLPQGYALSAAQLLNDRTVAGGAFRFAIAEPFPGSKFIEWSTNLRCQWWQMPFGDQGLFLRRSLFEELGGYADLPILEDYDLVKRLRRHGRVTTLKQFATTSGRRWQRLGVVRTTLINKWMILGYHLGWPLEKLQATYRGLDKAAANSAGDSKQK
jgi:hypothetical protein